MHALEALRLLLSSPLVSRAFAAATAGTVTMFALHRMAGAGHAYEGTSESLLRAALERLRADRYNLVSVEEVVAAGSESRSLPRRSVAFVADDGYLDQAEVLAPLLADYDCPLTVFLTTGFVDGALVPWWDRVGHALDRCTAPSLDVEVGHERLRLPLGDPVARRESTYRFLHAAKHVADAERLRAIEALVAASELDVPTVPFGQFQPMSWDDARRLEAGGLVRFGPHSVTHPILARLADADDVRREVTGSWNRLQEELAAPLPVFCYPNGQAEDFGERELAEVGAAGLAAAVAVSERATRLADLRDHERRFALDRVSFPGSVAKVIQAASGLDNLQRTVRRRAPATR